MEDIMGIGDHVQSNFGHDGWDPPQDYGEFRGGGGEGGGGGGGTHRGPYRFKLPVPEDNPIEKNKPARKRIMIIGAPFYLWEHGTYKVPNVPKGIFNAICLRQNKIEEACAMCDAKFWPSYGAYFTVIDLGFVRYDPRGGATLFPEPWTDKEGKRRESQFQRRLMVAKKGGKDNPGQLTYFEDQRARRGGDLTGCVFDTMRSGEKKAQIGEQWEFVERVGNAVPPPIAEMQQYLIDLGAPQEHVEKEYLFQRFTVKDMEEALLFDNAELSRWVGKGDAGTDGQAGGGRPARGTRTEGAGYGAGAGGSRPGPGEEGEFRNDSDFRGGGTKDW
jgi:hypothetical protein